MCVCVWVLDGLRYGIRGEHSQALSSNKQTGRSTACCNVGGTWKRIRLTSESRCVAGLCGEPVMGIMSVYSTEEEIICVVRVCVSTVLPTTRCGTWTSVCGRWNHVNESKKLMPGIKAEISCIPSTPKDPVRFCSVKRGSPFLWEQFTLATQPPTFIHLPVLSGQNNVHASTICSYKRNWPFLFKTGMCHIFPSDSSTKQKRKDDVHLE